MEHADYAAAVAYLRRQLLAYSGAAWASADLSDGGLERLVALMVPAVQSAQLSAATLTSVYFADKLRQDPLPVSDAVTKGRGVPPETVYARPIVTARTELSRGASVDKALAAGKRRLENIAGTDLQMAKVRQSRQSLSGGPQFYRRVPTGAENCALCLIAATQRYRVKNLMPIHPGCDCDVDIIPAGMDLNHVIDPEALAATHERVEEFGEIADSGGRASDYRKLIVDYEHGEVGPVLGWHDQKYTTAADLRARNAL